MQGELQALVCRCTFGEGPNVRKQEDLVLVWESDHSINHNYTVGVGGEGGVGGFLDVESPETGARELEVPGPP